MIFFVVWFIVLSLFLLYYSYKLIHARRQRKLEDFGEKITAYRKNYWYNANLFVLIPLMIMTAKNMLNHADYAKTALQTYTPDELTTEVVKSFQDDIAVVPFIIPFTVLFIVTMIIQSIVNLKKGTIYENGITDGTTFYFFSDMEKIEEHHDIHLTFKQRKGFSKSRRLNPHKKEKDRIRKILCDKVAYEQTFY